MYIYVCIYIYIYIECSELQSPLNKEKALENTFFFDFDLLCVKKRFKNHMKKYTMRSKMHKRKYTK